MTIQILASMDLADLQVTEGISKGKLDLYTVFQVSIERWADGHFQQYEAILAWK